MAFSTDSACVGGEEEVETSGINARGGINADTHHMNSRSQFLTATVQGVER
jgi:hypothetical protein